MNVYFKDEKNPFFYNLVLAISRERRAISTNPSRLFLVPLRPTYSQKMKLKARNQLG
jgi:hypothetical protein